MSDAGWQPDPFGRHQHRWWDGTAWTDQVADGGTVSTDPPTPTSPPTAAVPTTPSPTVPAPGASPYPTGPPSATPGGRKAPVALLAVVGLVVVALVAGLVLVLTGGDDGGDEEAVATTENRDRDEDDGSGEDDASDDLSDDASDDLTDDVSDDFSEDLTDDFTDDFTDEESTGVTTPPPDDVSANNLRAGDCVVDEDTLYSSTVTTVPCGQSHVFEVLGKFDVPGLTYPGDASLEETGRRRCTGRLFTRYVGVPYAVSTVYASALPPSRDTWNQAGDRTVLCLGHTQDLSPTTGSYRGANV